MENELTFNASRLSAQEQETLRKKIIRDMKKHGNTKTVAEICECSLRHVQATWKRYNEKGIQGIHSVKAGRPTNTGKLNEEQQAIIRKLITDKCPNQLKLKGFLWDRQQVRDLMKRIYGVSMSVQAVGAYLRKWGFTSQRPRRQNYKQQPEEVKKWLNETYPEIESKAKKENAEIHWGDETGCQNECNYVKGYAPIGQTPVLPVSTDKHRVNIISTVTNQGKLRFMFFDGSFNAEVFLTFIKRLVNESTRKVYLIVDNLKSHHAKIVTAWVAKHKERIEIFYLPPYCPEYNPDEYLNGNLKRELAKKGYVRSKKEMEHNTRSVLKIFQRDKKHVARLFNAEKVQYAASDA
jgi:transposase